MRPLRAINVLVNKANAKRLKVKKAGEDFVGTKIPDTKRLMVPGGWLVLYSSSLHDEAGLCFYPDSDHSWEPGKEIKDIVPAEVDLKEVPENEGCMVRDDWPHAIPVLG